MKSTAVLSAMVLLLLMGCMIAPARPQELPRSPGPASAAFTFKPLQVAPLQIAAGEPFTVSMEVGNDGTAAGTYRADFYVDGNLIDSAVLGVAPAQSATAVFKTTLNDTVMHQIKIGPQSLSVAAGERRIPVTLKIDNGVVDGCDPVIGSTANPSEVTPQSDGNMIKFATPPGGFHITGIQIVGNIKSSTYDFDHDPVFGPGTWVYGPDIASAQPVRPDFTINIYGDHRNKLFSGTYDKQLFTYALTTVKIPVQDVRVDGDFYVELQTYNMPRLNAVGLFDRDLFGRYVVHTWYYQLCIGYESATDVQSWVSEDGTAIPSRYLIYNWIIRADGYQTQK